MSTDAFHPLQPEFLLRLLLHELPQHERLHELLFPELHHAFHPRSDDHFRIRVHGLELETPLGAAAGPHTQLSWNIVAAWLAGARFIELKTVQELDTLTLSKPCIDARDEGYNCEWSQELSLEQSYREYLHAWVIIHILRHTLGHDTTNGPGFMFNMSAGYDLEGICSDKVTRFLDSMADARADIDALRQRLAPIYPPVQSAKTLPIAAQISHNLTVSTMHGCPPEEIERIGRYFLEQRGLHTTIKLNPTLLGAHDVRQILNTQLGWPINVPDDAFAHDLQFDQAVTLIRHMQEAARTAGRDFRVKLTNTLETTNTGHTLPSCESNVYMSGRALHPLAIELAKRLQMSFDGSLDLSFSAGVNLDTVTDCLACGLAPLTVCTDLLKPGGYGRLHGMLKKLRENASAPTMQPRLFVHQDKRISRLTDYAARCADPDGLCSKNAHLPARKFARPLPRYDCSAAPCQELCPSGLHQPEWLGIFAQENGKLGRFDTVARHAMFNTNPLLNTQAAFCDTVCRHKCERVCVRAALGSPVRIHSVHQRVEDGRALPHSNAGKGKTAHIYGDGVAALACAAILMQAGLSVSVIATPDKIVDRKLGPAINEGLARDKAVLEHQGVVFVAAEDNTQIVPALLFYSADATTPAPKGSGPGVIIGLQATCGAASLRAAVREGCESARALLAAIGVSLPAMAQRDAFQVFIKKMNVQAMPPTPNLAVLSDEQIQREAQRCLQCDLYCGLCTSACPNHALAPLPSPALAVPVLRLEAQNNGWAISVERRLLCRDPAQIVHIPDLCNECGHCALLCPSSGAPFRDKAHIHLSEASFQSALSAGQLGHYWLCGPENLRSASASLTRIEKGLHYENQTVTALFDADTLAPIHASAHGTIQLPQILDEAAEMLLLFLLTDPLRRCL